MEGRRRGGDWRWGGLVSTSSTGCLEEGVRTVSIMYKYYLYRIGVSTRLSGGDGRAVILN